MIYRMRTYKIFPEQYEVFTDFFHNYLLPNQLTFGSKLVGRWTNEKKNEIVAIWKYDSIEKYEKIEKQIQKTELHRDAQTIKKQLGELYIETNQTFWESTGKYEQ
ncbi:NIPSNAP family protein [Rossellomorea sp. DUT-2]|uniref:NIPSNAP family protein n=1 Tax=Rossellomorea sp. DUT-2 TaxID=3412021 RepID=UPI003D17D3F8